MHGLSHLFCTFLINIFSVSEKLDVVRAEIEELRKLLQEKEILEAELSITVDTHTSAIQQIRTKFTRQLNRVEKKELAVQESRDEWQAEKTAYNQMKESHDAELQAHADSLLQHDELVKQVHFEIRAAEALHRVLSQEITIMSDEDEKKQNTTEQENGNHYSEEWEMDVLKCEAALVEANQLLTAAQSSINSLRDEIDQIDVSIPILEDLKKSAASKRDFKAAGKASREIKEAIAKKERLEEELNGEAQERKDNAAVALETLSHELDSKKKIALERERENGLKKMESLAEKISRLETVKEELSTELDSSGSVYDAGLSILNNEIATYRDEGESLGSSFGGWDLILEKYSLGHCNEQPSSSTAVEKEDDRIYYDDEVETSDHEVEESVVDKDKNNNEINHSAVERYKYLKVSVSQLEEELEEAIAKEDYDTAAELDEKFQEMVAELGSMDLTDSEMDLVSSSQNEVEESQTNHDSMVDTTVVDSHDVEKITEITEKATDKDVSAEVKNDDISEVESGDNQQAATAKEIVADNDIKDAVKADVIDEIEKEDAKDLIEEKVSVSDADKDNGSKK